MKSLFRLPLPILAIAALTAACNPFTPKTSTPQNPKDPRFSEFVFQSDKEPTVKDQTDSVNLRWPSMEASEAHLAIAYSRQTGSLPDKDPEFWLTAVATVPDKTIQLLVEKPPTHSCLESIPLSTSTYPRSASSPPSIRPSRTRPSHPISPTFQTISAP